MAAFRCAVLLVIAMLVSAPFSEGLTSTQYLEIRGGRLAYDDTGGTGPLVIAAAGIGDLRQEYRFLTPLLHNAGYRVVTVDIRGFGQTDAYWPDYSARSIGADLLQLEAELGRHQAILVGNSYSAGSVVWAAHDAPERVRAMVLIGPVVRDPPASPWYNRLFMDFAFAGPWSRSFWLAYWDNLFVLQKPPDQKIYRDLLAANLRQPGRMQALHAMIETSKADTMAILSQVRTPALIIMGTRDPDHHDPAGEAAWIAHETGGQTLLISGAGHYPQTEAPEQVASGIVTFLDRLE